MSDPVRTFIEGYITRQVAAAPTATRYRPPLVGFAAADDPAWARLRQVAHPTHFLPTDLLPGARTVAAFFVPFAEEIVEANRRSETVSREWALAYVETNSLIHRIVEGLVAALGERGVRAVGRPPTGDYDADTLMSRWSNKSAAAIAGLGSFGLHRMLITDLGCAGRCGSWVMDAEVELTSGPQPERCLYFSDGSCTVCVGACPAGALREAAPGEPNLDRQRCHEYIRQTNQRFADLPSSASCGKCALGPCALAPAT
ncbi:MAG: epoxyqueuosine reductase [Anaerolineae bacterium]